MEMTPFNRIALDVFQDKNSCVQGRYTRKYVPELVSGFSRDKAECTLNSFQGIVAYTEMFALTLKDDKTNDKRTEKDRQNANASAKSKELHPHPQSQPNAAHLLLPQPLTKPDKE